VFKSDTDTEVLVHLIDDIQRTEKVDLAEAVRLALAVAWWGRTPSWCWTANRRT
jgi:hypothetical protein